MAEKRLIGIDVASGEHSIENKIRQASKTNVQFDNQMEDANSVKNLRTSMMIHNKNLLKVYLKTPYKVLSIRDVNRKLKNKNNKDVQLFRAENLLQVHTNFRNETVPNTH